MKTLTNCRSLVLKSENFRSAWHIPISHNYQDRYSKKKTDRVFFFLLLSVFSWSNAIDWIHLNGERFVYLPFENKIKKKQKKISFNFNSSFLFAKFAAHSLMFVRGLKPNVRVHTKVFYIEKMCKYIGNATIIIII